MGNVNRSDQEAVDTEPSRDSSPAPGLAWGPGMSVALSLAFFLVALAVGLGLDDSRHRRSMDTATTDSLDAASIVSEANTTVTSDTSTQSSDPASTLLAHARECAAAGQWTCVIEATNNVIALRGDTPDTRALLEQAVIKGGWIPHQDAPGTRDDAAAHAQAAQPFAARTPQGARHGPRYPMRTRPMKYPKTGSTSDEDAAVLYRH